MFLILDVTSANANVLGPAARMVFGLQGGTIGRRPGNDWVLPDPHVSGRHARIRAMSGTFFLEDNESGNGVLVNGNKIHAGEPFPLKDGDLVFIDPFEIAVRVSAVRPTGATEVLPTAEVVARPPEPPVPAPAPSLKDLDLLPGAFAAEDEYNALLAERPVATDPRGPTREDLHGKSILQDALSIRTPAADRGPGQTPGGPVIPDDWYLDPEPAIEPPPVAAPPAQRSPPPPSPPTPAPKEVPAPAQPRAVPAPPGSPGAAMAPDIRALLRGAGLDAEHVDPEIVAQLGQVLRIVVEGLMEVLQARGEIKGEFRLQQTSFKPRENNPLKFSANVEDALHNLLVKRNAAYLDTPAAFEDAFVDVRHHQVAMLAGMRAAFNFMLSRFDPAALAKQFDARPGRKLSIGLGAAGRHWEGFEEYYKEVTREPDDCFRRLFGDQFARAYEEQLQRLRAAKRGSA